MGRTRKKDSSIVFIGEDEDKTPLLQQDAWTSGKSSKNTASSSSLKSSNIGKSGKLNQSKKKTSFICGDKPFPKSFVQYLFSESSVLIRMFSSLFPPFGRFNRISVDFEGSFLSSFLLTATVYWGLVNSKGEARIISLFYALALTLGYLLSITAFTWILSSCTKTNITFRQMVCVLGYGLFGHALTLLICEAGSDEWFLPLMTIIGGLDSVRICLILLARTPVPACRFVLCTPVAIVHLMYLVYLHFAIMKTYDK